MQEETRPRVKTATASGQTPFSQRLKWETRSLCIFITGLEDVHIFIQELLRISLHFAACGYSLIRLGKYETAQLMSFMIPDISNA